MSYVVYPTSVQGLGFLSMRGLGGYEEDLAQWKRATADLTAWQAEKAAYDKAMKNYAAAYQGVSSGNASAQGQWAGEMGRWQVKQNAYSLAKSSYDAGQASLKAGNMAKSQSIAKLYGLSLPSGYPGCISAAEHQKWADVCAIASVKGLGGAWATNSVACGMAQLPVCVTPPKPPVGPGPAPKKPVPAPLPTKPADLRARPADPGTRPTPPPPPPLPTPTVTTVTDTPVPVPTPPKRNSLVMGGILAIVVLGGGFALYRTFKPPKKAAA